MKIPVNFNVPTNFFRNNKEFEVLRSQFVSPEFFTICLTSIRQILCR